MTDAFVRVIGLALAHSLWQGAAIALVAAIVLRVLSGAPARTRYATLVGALLLHVAAPLATVAWLARSHPPIIIDAPIVTSGPRAAAPTSAATSTQIAYRSAALFISPPRSGGVPERFVSLTRQLDDILPFAVALWALGVTIGFARLFGAWLLLRRFVARATPATGALDARVRTLARRIGGSRSIRVLTTPALRSPFTSGMLRPVIVVPLSMLTGLDQASIDAIIVHELAHIRRWDYAVTLLQSAVMTLLFHHPASWWLDRQLRIEREYCCDDIVIDRSHDRVAYVRALANLEALGGGTPSLALSATDGSLLDRAERLLGVRRAPQPSAWVPALSLVALLAASSMLDARSVRPPLTAAPAADVTTRSTPMIAKQDTVLVAPNARASLDERWKWALAQARDGGDEVTIGWRIRSAVSDLGMVVSSTDGTSMEGGPSVNTVLELPNPIHAGVALLFTWSGANNRLDGVRLRSMDASAPTHGRRVLWLGDADDVSSIGMIEQIMRSASEPMRRELGAALTLHDDTPRVISAVHRIITSDSASVRAETLAWLGRQRRSTTARSLLWRGIEDPSAQVRDEALSSLLTTPGSEATLRELVLTSPHADVRSEIVQRISGNDQETIDLLLRVAFDDKNYSVRAEAVDAIKEMSGPLVTAALRRIATKHADAQLRSEALDALGERGIRE